MAIGETRRPSPVDRGSETPSDRGPLITLEGTDGSGKSTQMNRISDWLGRRGIDHLTTFEPGGTALGENIRRCFLDAPEDQPDGKLEAMLMFADRRHHLSRVIRPALATGRIVLCDRFTDSTIAYQGFGRGVDRSELEALDRWATGGMAADLTLLFDVPAETAAGRARSGEGRDNNRLDHEHAEFYRRVRRGYHELAESNPDRIRVIDASSGVDETCEQAIAVVAEWLSSHRGLEIAF